MIPVGKSQPDGPSSASTAKGVEIFQVQGLPAVQRTHSEAAMRELLSSFFGFANNEGLIFIAGG